MEVGLQNGREDRIDTQQVGRNWVTGGIRTAPLTLIVAPESLILGFLGVEVF